MRRHKKITIGVVIVLLLLGFLLRPKPNAPLEITKIQPHTLVQTVSVSGSIDAINKVDLSFLAAGQLVYIGAKKNDIVTAGQTIAQEDNRTVLKNLQAAILSYNLQRDTYDQSIANNGGRTNPNDALNDTMKRVIQDNQNNLDKAINSVELQDLARQQSFLVSPISGVLTRADAVSIGTTALPTTIFEVVDPSSLVFAMDVDEADIGKVRTGQRVKLVLDPYPNTVYTLPVDSIDYVSHTTSNGGTAYTVRVKLPGDDISRFRIGINGEADIITAEKSHILTVPIAALFNDTYVYVQTGKMYQKRKLTLGLQNDTDAEVLSGLHEGDIVVLQPSKVPQNKVLSK